MKKILSFILLVPVWVAAQTGESKNFTITGTVPGFADGTEVKLYRNGDNTELASGKFAKGSFVLKGSVNEPVLTFISMADKNIELYMENSKISITPNTKETGKFNITGSKSHNDFVEFVTKFTPLVQQMSSLANSINSMPAGAERESLMGTYNNVVARIQNEIDSFVVKKPRSSVSPFVLSVTSRFYDDPLLLEKRYNMMDASVKKLESSKQLEQLIASNKIGAIGTEAADFTQPDTSGVAVKLSSLRGKYVLVDFWASWCGPCRSENPNVLNNFNKFKTKNFTILGVSLDRPGQKDKWLQAIHDDNLAWTQVSDLQWWDNAAAKLYRVQGIPQNFLLDPNGKIVAKNLRGGDLEAKLCELLGCN